MWIPMLSSALSVPVQRIWYFSIKQGSVILGPSSVCYHSHMIILSCRCKHGELLSRSVNKHAFIIHFVFSVKS